MTGHRNIITTVRRAARFVTKNFSVSHRGHDDITRRAAGLFHKTNIVRENASKLITYFVMKKLDSNACKVTAAVCTKVYQTVQHEHSYHSADSDTKLWQVVFPDSDIVFNFVACSISEIIFQTLSRSSNIWVTCWFIP